MSLGRRAGWGSHLVTGETVNSRERAVRAIEMGRPDRVPITHATLQGAITRYGPDLEDLYRRYPSDVFGVGSATTGEFGPRIGEPSRDTWGALWVRYTDEHKGQVVVHPLADWDDLYSYELPDTATDDILAALGENLRLNGGLRYTMADGDCLWQRMFYLHGYQATLEDLLVRPDRCADLRDMILSVMGRRVEELCRFRELDGIHFRDDWGTQQALMIDPKLWRSFFKLAYAQLFAMARDAGKHVWFHSDGIIHSIIPDLIEIGVQVLNPQVDVIPRDTVVSLCAGHICLEGDVDRQRTLPYGTPFDVRAAVRADIDDFGRFNGGYIGRGEAAGDVPLDNLAALLDEIVRYGTYAPTS